MGMYTELLFNAELNLKNAEGEIDPQLVQIIQTMTGKGEPLRGHATWTPDHPLFESDRWGYVLCGSSAYFVTGETKFWYDDIAKAHFLTATSSIKNYGNEIDLFLDWVHPYVDHYAGFCGYKRYEEDESPTLIYRADDGFKFVAAVPPAQ